MLDAQTFFNVSNFTRLRHARHDNFVEDIRIPTCELAGLLQYVERCKFVQGEKECHADTFIIDYPDLYYCQMAPEKTYAVFFCILFLLVLCVLLFVILGQTADAFFCPSLKVLSKMMGLSENLAGVTLLAFGNAAPDVFTTFAGLQAEAREAYNDVIGGACFVALLVTAAIIITKPFKITPSSFLRDILFLVLDLVYMDYAIKSGNVVTLFEAVTIISMYFIYILIICIDQYLLVRAAKTGDSQRLKSLQSEAHIDILSRSSHRPTVIYKEGYHSDSNMKSPKGRNAGLLKQFFRTLNVLDLEEFRESNVLSKIFTILQLPIMLCLTLFIPIVDYEINLNGWSKLLNCLQLFFLPACIVYGFLKDGMPIFEVPLAFWFFLISVPLSIVCFIFSRTDKAPAFHRFFSILGVLASVFVVYGCASELIQILKLLGIITHRSNSFLGCTLLAWGNSVGDLISNMAMAKHGYQKMGFAACFGGPLFNTLLNIGGVFTYKASTTPSGEFKTGEGTLGETSNIFLLIGLGVFTLGVLSTNFELRRSVGLIPFVIYIIYLGYAISGEFEFIHPYGSDHRLDVKAEPADL